MQAVIQAVTDDIGAHINIGRSYNHMGRLHQAERAYLRAK